MKKSVLFLCTLVLTSACSLKVEEYTSADLKAASPKQSATDRFQVIADAKNRIPVGVDTHYVIDLYGNPSEIWEGTWWIYDQTAGNDAYFIVSDSVLYITNEQFRTLPDWSVEDIENRFGAPSRLETGRVWRYNAHEPNTIRGSSAVIYVRDTNVVRVDSWIWQLE